MIGKYRAAWFAVGSHIAYGNWTDLGSAQEELLFLSKYRDAWIENSDGKRVEFPATQIKELQEKADEPESENTQ